MTQNKVSIQKYAMQFGTMLGIFWIGKFIFFPLGLKYSFFSIVFLVLTCAGPYLGYRYLCMFRDKVLGGQINFSSAWAFSVFMYIFAALLVGVAHYIYFQFIDQGLMINSSIGYLESMSQANEIKDNGEIQENIKVLIDQFEAVRALPSIQIVLQLLYNNIILGGIISLPVALFASRRKRNISSSTKN